MPLFICKALARKPLLQNFDLRLEEGQIVVLCAPSASGKTLLLRAIADLDPIDGGELHLAGRERSDYSPQDWRQRVIYLHQSPVRLPGSVLDNWRAVMDLAVHAPGSDSNELLPADLDQELDVRQLSGGEMQRFALARAIALRPQVLLLDEATSALDGEAARAAERQVLAFVRTGAAALWVSHDSELATRLDAKQVSLAK